MSLPEKCWPQLKYLKCVLLDIRLLMMWWVIQVSWTPSKVHINVWFWWHYVSWKIYDSYDTRSIQMLWVVLRKAEPSIVNRVRTWEFRKASSLNLVKGCLRALLILSPFVHSNWSNYSILAHVFIWFWCWCILPIMCSRQKDWTPL